jgi:hypothetical protein
LSQQRQKKRTRAHSESPEATPNDLATTGSREFIPDEHGYLAIGMAAGAMAIVAVLTLMIMLAAI